MLVFTIKCWYAESSFLDAIHQDKWLIDIDVRPMQAQLENV